VSRWRPNCAPSDSLGLLAERLDPPDPEWFERFSEWMHVLAWEDPDRFYTVQAELRDPPSDLDEHGLPTAAAMERLRVWWQAKERTLH
jgi:hypothetical protein